MLSGLDVVILWASLLKSDSGSGCRVLADVGVECLQMWVLSERPVKVGIESTYASFDLIEWLRNLDRSFRKVVVGWL